MNTNNCEARYEDQQVLLIVLNTSSENISNGFPSHFLSSSNKNSKLFYYAYN